MHDWITNLVRPNQLIHPFILSPSIHQFNLSLSIHQFTRSPSIRQFILSPTIHQFNLSPSIHQIILVSIHRYKCANSLSAVHRCPFIQFYVQLYVRVHTFIQIYLYIYTVYIHLSNALQKMQSSPLCLSAPYWLHFLRAFIHVFVPPLSPNPI